MRCRTLARCALMAILFVTFAAAFAQERTGLIFLVRHAEKASDAKDALLSPEGHRRAQCLAHLLGDAGIREILVTQVVRTQQTAEPLVKELGLKPTIMQADNIDAFVNKLHATRGENVLVVGHADTLPNIIEKLGAGKVAMENAEYDKLFVFHYDPGASGGMVTTLRYCDCK